MIPIKQDNLMPVPESGCLIWIGGATADGYGSMRVRYKHYLVHRAAWENENGPIPDGMHVCHKCDVPSCCRVDHLFLGTNRDNIQDSVRKGRRKGISGNRGKWKSGVKCKWTEKEVLARNARRKIKDDSLFKQLVASGFSQRDIARRLGVSQPTVNTHMKRLV